MADHRDGFHDLPILAELGSDLHRAAGQADEREASVPSRKATQGDGGRRRSQWLTRRPALMAAAVLILVALPIALTAGLSGTSSDREAGQGAEQVTSAAGEAGALARGTGPEEAWVLSAREAGCVGLDLAGRPAATTACSRESDQESAAAGAEDRGALRPEAARTPAGDIAVVNGSRDGFVFGIVPDTAVSVRVTIGDGGPITAPVRAMSTQGAGAEAKTFVAAVDEPIPPRARVTVIALDDRGGVVARHRTGRSP
ncbi:MAG: hypothetical protein AVDCRST_MAG69-181 [uncultured Solirubrobacteraceae bacterium]|uniref:Uncharacterized protein n=1 Tax=uncultured Solirubrobacteraceae bacterium TaxID=1162706 RepID=A0A6J4RGS7_9ACTN|nr:MAG: hypothetical protein AVDCRST_MAG69-181 [uncultured Solirubrobacteraceae bacterium]